MVLSEGVEIAAESDVYKIFDFAKGRYEEKRINGPDIKLPWWKKNPYIFYVIYDQERKVCANINILPIKSECYFKLRNGEISEKEITPEDIWSPNEKNNIHYIYIEGFNCKFKSQAFVILSQFDSLINNLIESDKEQIKIGAIGGTKEGITIMKKLGFNIVSSTEGLQGKYFFEIHYPSLINSLKARRII